MIKTPVSRHTNEGCFIGHVGISYLMLPNAGGMSGYELSASVVTSPSFNLKSYQSSSVVARISFLGGFVAIISIQMHLPY